MSFRAIIFDLDGVIVHTDEFHYLGWKKLADRMGIYFDKQINNRCRGVSRMESLDILLEKSLKSYTAKEKKALAEEKNLYYREFLNEMTAADITDDVRETLNYLKNIGYKLAIGSSSKNARIILSKVGLDSFFHAVADGSDISHSKPNPEVFLLAAERLGELPKRCIVVEDAASGIEAGKQGGMTTVAIGAAVETAIADYSISNLSQLLTLSFIGGGNSGR